MHGIGNDFVLLDVRMRSLDTHVEDSELARVMCDRRFGIGADGLIFVEPTPAADARMRMLNPDGSESEMCGNGLRCVASLLDRPQSAIETGGRIVRAELVPGGEIRVDMGVATVLNLALEVGGFSGVSVSVGNPHFVVFCESADAVDIESIGPQIEHDAAFPDRTNVHFAQIVDRSTIKQRTWERGAGATLACGSGACAGALAAFVTGRTGAEVTMHLPGGALQLEVSNQGQVWMTGPAEAVFQGEFRLD